MVSAIITTYKREIDILERAILSVLKQTYQDIEVLVVDDNDNNSPLCSEIRILCSKYPIVKYIKQDGNKGACSARNLGISKSKGEYIAFLDDDDEWIDCKIEKQMRVFAQADNMVGLVFCNGIQRNEDTGEERDYCSHSVFKTSVKFDELLGYDFIGSTSHPLIRKECFDVVGGFWESQPARQDYEMWIRISTKYRIIGICENLFIHNIHEGEQISKNNHKGQIGYKNIYLRYRNYYKKNKKAQIGILSRIISAREKITIEVLYYYVKREMLKIFVGISRVNA
jgi:glycosyltransferase involved in cell wall biosynthesis